MTFCKTCEKLGLCTASAMIGNQTEYADHHVPEIKTPDAIYSADWMASLRKLYALLIEKFPACPNEEYARELASLKEILDTQ